MGTPMWGRLRTKSRDLDVVRLTDYFCRVNWQKFVLLWSWSVKLRRVNTELLRLEWSKSMFSPSIFLCYIYIYISWVDRFEWWCFVGWIIFFMNKLIFRPYSMDRHSFSLNWIGLLKKIYIYIIFNYKI